VTVLADVDTSLTELHASMEPGRRAHRQPDQPLPTRLWKWNHCCRRHPRRPSPAQDPELRRAQTLCRGLPHPLHRCEVHDVEL